MWRYIGNGTYSYETVIKYLPNLLDISQTFHDFLVSIVILFGQIKLTKIAQNGHKLNKIV
jgi:hypothetical protein